ncbi:MAG: cell wall-binding repeat-containing protein [Propioniciclava sp.]
MKAARIPLRVLIATCALILPAALMVPIPATADSNAEVTTVTEPLDALERGVGDLDLPVTTPGARVQLAEAPLAESVGVAAVTMPPGSADADIFVREVVDGVPGEWTQIELDAASEEAAVAGTEPVVVTRASAAEAASVQVATVSNEPVKATLSVSSAEASNAPLTYARNSPKIIDRASWKAAPAKHDYTYAKVTGAMIHHTAGDNTYSQSEVPAILRAIQAYHQDQRGWNDIAYNYLVDKFGRVWEGRGGGVDRAVQGAHAYGLTNARVLGISLMGNFDTATPSAAVLDSTAHVIAWKFRHHGVDPAVKTYGSGGSKGKNTTLDAISLHQHESATACPGKNVVAKLSTIKSTVGTLLTTTYPEPGLAGFDPANLVSDQAFFNSSAMTERDIRNFIEGKGRACTDAPDGTPCLRNYRVTTPAKAANAYCTGAVNAVTNNSPWGMIAQISKACGVNPQVLLTLLQKEQGLVLGSGSYLKPSRYESATGAGCPDAKACDATTTGLFLQLYSAAERFQKYRALSSYRYQVGTETIGYHPSKLCGAATVTIANQATAGLYNYTPFVPNQAALDAGAGEGDACSAYGTRNFYRYMKLWFPDSMNRSAAKPIAPTPLRGSTLLAVQKSGSFRLAGKDRYETAAAVSAQTTPAYQRTVFLASGTSFPDALSAGTDASAAGAPILLSAKTRLPATTKKELARIKPAEIVVVGGTAVLNDSVVKQAASAAGNAKITRVAGDNRYATSAKLAERGAAPTTIFLTSGEAFPDGLVAAPAAIELGKSRILLTAKKSLPAPIRSSLAAVKPTKVVVIGGTGAIWDTVVRDVRKAVPGVTVERISGSTRYETATAVAKKYWPAQTQTVFVASGLKFPDALSGAPAAGASQAPLLLSKPTCHPATTRSELTRLAAKHQATLGGSSSVYQGTGVCG